MLVLGKFLSLEVGIGIQCNAQLHTVYAFCWPINFISFMNFV